MANGKFWILMHNGGLVMPSWATPSFRLKTRTIMGMGCPSLSIDHYAHFTELRTAEKAASEITKKYGGDVYIMESIALATVPTTIVKIEG